MSSGQLCLLSLIERLLLAQVLLLPGVVDNPGTAEVQGFSGNASFNVNGCLKNWFYVGHTQKEYTPLSPPCVACTRGVRLANRATHQPACGDGRNLTGQASRRQGRVPKTHSTSRADAPHTF